MIVHYNQKKLSLAQPRIMGILNLTPNSFSDGGDFYDPEKALDHALKMIDEGADILDIGAESTNPKANPISADEEIARLLPVIRHLVGRVKVPISIDSFRAKTIGVMIDEGVDIINDVTGLGDPNTLAHLKRSDVAICLMHMLGNHETMHINGDYSEKGIVKSVADHLQERVNLCLDAGIEPQRILLDPGFGFDKSMNENLSLLKELNQLNALNFPLLIGVSRKRMIGHITHEPIAKNRTIGSVTAALWAKENGAAIIRVHDVKATKEAFMMWDAIKDAQIP